MTATNEADLAGGHADRSWESRLKAWIRPSVLILDDLAMREFTPGQADDLYELVTERTKKSLIITANRAANDWYSLFPIPFSRPDSTPSDYIARDLTYGAPPLSSSGAKTQWTRAGARSSTLDCTQAAAASSKYSTRERLPCLK